MQQAFELAKKGFGNVSPNPLVGAVIVKNNKVIARGFHANVGGDHAEAAAIKNTTESLEGSTLYCNLEPCSHTNKRTPPCAPSIVKAGIKKVVIANLDPNPLVAGNGLKLLKQHGVEVITGIMDKEGRELNEIFFTHITQNRAFVHLKMAQTLDGNFATATGDSKWITSEEARQLVHEQRLQYDAIVVGSGTAIYDDPTLTARLANHPPQVKFRLILSRSGKLPHNLKVFTDDFQNYTWIVLPEGNVPESDINCKFQNLRCPLLENGEFDLHALNKIVYDKLKITSLYVEGGAKLHTSFFKQNAYDRVSVFIAPKIIGASTAKIGDLNHIKMNQAITFQLPKWNQIGPDMYFTALNANLDLDLNLK